MRNSYFSSPTVSNCTFSGNSTTTNGGGMYNIDNSNPTLNNCILWGDFPYPILDEDAPSSSSS